MTWVGRFGISWYVEEREQRQTNPEDNLVFCVKMIADHHCHLVEIFAGILGKLIHGSLGGLGLLGHLQQLVPKLDLGHVVQ